MGMLELWRAPKPTATSAELIVYFSVIMSFRHPSAHALACYIFMVLLPKGVPWRVGQYDLSSRSTAGEFLIIGIRSGISLLSPSLLLLGLNAIPTGWIKQFSEFFRLPAS